MQVAMKKSHPWNIRWLYWATEELYLESLVSYSSTDIPMDIRVCCGALSEPAMMRSRVICSHYTMGTNKGSQTLVSTRNTTSGVRRSEVELENLHLWLSSQLILMLRVQKPCIENHQIKMYYNIPISSVSCPPRIPGSNQHTQVYHKTSLQPRKLSFVMMPSTVPFLPSTLPNNQGLPVTRTLGARTLVGQLHVCSLPHVSTPSREPDLTPFASGNICHISQLAKPGSSPESWAPWWDCA